MEIILLLILIVLFFVIKTAISEIDNKQKKILNVLQHMQEELYEAKKTIAKLQKLEPSKEKIVTKPTVTYEDSKVEDKTPVFIPPVFSRAKIEHEVTNTESKYAFSEPKPSTLQEVIIDKHFTENNEATENLDDSKGIWEKFISKNPDVEKFIGENLINKIGIAVLVLGIAFFIKYAIDKNWINEIGRVGIGVFCGALLIGIAHYLRNTYRSFSSVLVGGGLTVLYFSIGFAFQQYQMFSQTTAFVLVCIITLLAIVLCIFYDRLELGIIATIGGFATPFIVSTGTGNYIVLFTYLSILNSGLIGLAYLKNWRSVQYVAFVFTTIIYSSWLYNRISINEIPINGAFMFATIFYLIFICITILHHVFKKRTLKPADFTLLLSINISYFVCGITIIEQIKSANYNGLFTLMLAIFNSVILWLIYTKKEIDKNLFFLFAAVTITYVSLIAPIQFDGSSIVLFWSAEMLVLFWLYQKSNFRLLKFATLILIVFVLLSLIVHLNGYDLLSSTPTILFNKQFITYLFSGSCFLVLSILLNKEANTYFELNITTKFIKNFAYVTAIILFFITGFAEISYQISTRTNISNASLICLNVFVTAFAILILYTHKASLTFSTNFSKAILLLAVLFFKLLTWFFIIDNLENAIVSHQHQWQILVFFIGEIFLYFLYNICISWFVKTNETNNNINYTLFYTIGLLVNLSATFLIVYLMISQPSIETIEKYQDIYNRAGLSILWGLLSFIAMWLGMKKANKTLRLFALFLFAITLIKLAVIDIQKMNEAGKIIAFILLGAILLTVSFMYQRLKKLINSEEIEKSSD